MTERKRMEWKQKITRKSIVWKMAEMALRERRKEDIVASWWCGIHPKTPRTPAGNHFPISLSSDVCPGPADKAPETLREPARDRYRVGWGHLLTDWGPALGCY